MALIYPKKYKKDINLEIWDIDINPINTKQQDLNKFLIYCIVHYTDVTKTMYHMRTLDEQALDSKN